MPQGVLTSYKQFLPINENTPIFTLGEGQTPLIKSRNIVKIIGCRELYFKFEGCTLRDRSKIEAWYLQ